MRAFRAFLIVVGFLLVLSGRIVAQEETQEGLGFESYGDEEAWSGSTDETEADYEHKKERDPMNWIGFGLKAGFLYFGDATYNADVYVNGVLVVKNHGIPARAGLVLSLPFNLGASGFGWVFEPFLGFGQVGSWGAYTGPVITAHLWDMIYFGVGLGIRVGIITVDFWSDARTDLGIDIYGRVPVDLTFYVADSLGLLLEVAFGYGGSGYKPEPPQQQQLPQGVIIPKQDLKFGTTFQIDASAGVRFP